MIKRIIAGTLSAVLCSSVAPTCLSDSVIHASSSINVYDVNFDTDLVIKAEEPTSESETTTENATESPVETPIETTTTVKTEAATESTTETTTISSGENSKDEEAVETILLGENISADIYEDGYVHIKGYGTMDDQKSSPFKEKMVKQVYIENEDESRDLVISNIGNNMFSGCTTLTAVSDKKEFTDETVKLPDSIKTIGNGAFSECSAIKAIELDSVETIESYALAKCTGLKSLTIPENVLSMGRMTLNGCTELTELTLAYAATDASCAAAEGPIDPDRSVADLFIDHHWNWENADMDFSDYKLTKITINGGDKIPRCAFANMKNLTEIDLSGSSITAIEERAFDNCSSLTDIKLPETLKSIGYAAFNNCSSVKEFKLIDGLETIAEYAFANCTGFSAFSIPDSVISMGRMAFNGCTELTELKLPYASTDASCAAAEGPIDPDRSVADLFINNHWNWENTDMDFSDYKLTKIIISGGERVPRCAFSRMTGLKEVDLSGTQITAIDSQAFYNCTSLTNIKIPETLISIGDYAYSATPITELPDNGKIKTLGNGVFADCKNLEITTVPESYESIGQYGFSNCTGIKTFVIPATVTSMGRMLFNGCSELTELTLPYAATDANCAAAEGPIDPDRSVADLFIDHHWNWENANMDFSDYKLTKITINGGDKIPRYAFANMKNLTEIDLSGSSITAIDERAFDNCSSLTEIKLPETLKTIGYAAFCNCSSIEEFKLIDGLETIAEYAFANCTGISALSIPESVTSMGRMMVNGCYALETLKLPYAGTTLTCATSDGGITPDCGVADLFIDQHWNWENSSMDFSRYGISKIIITGGEKVPQYAFSNMSTLREVDICGSEIAKIEKYAFNNCSALMMAEIPESVKTIEGGAFSGTDSDLYVYGKECEIADKAVNDEYSATIHGYNESKSKTYADDNEFNFEPLDGELVINPKVLSMAIGDTYTVKTGAEGVTFSSSDDSIATVDKQGIITAIAEGAVSISAVGSDGTSVSIDVTVRPRVSLYTLGDVNEDGNVDAKDASLILSEYAKLSTGDESTFSDLQKSAADVNSDGNIDAKDASAILAYYAYLSTGGSGDLESYLK